jgi:hypothetical protein
LNLAIPEMTSASA